MKVEWCLLCKFLEVRFGARGCTFSFSWKPDDNLVVCSRRLARKGCVLLK